MAIYWIKICLKGVSIGCGCRRFLGRPMNASTTAHSRRLHPSVTNGTRRYASIRVDAPHYRTQVFVKISVIVNTIKPKYAAVTKLKSNV